jgi:serine/threonine-protein kinase RsbW
MTTPSYPCPDDGDRFADNGVGADARNAGRVRDEFAGWLRGRVDLDDVRFSDAVLAVNEALANAANSLTCNTVGWARSTWRQCRTALPPR